MFVAIREPVDTINGRAALCGVLAGNDLLLSEVSAIADGVRNSFACTSFDLATVNDEETFSGRLAVVVMLFESATKSENYAPVPNVMSGRKRRNKNPLGNGATGRGRFKNAEPTIWNGEDLDIPTFIRKSLNLDF